VAPKTAKTMEILEFVKSADVDPIYFESSYYMAPDEAGEKPYALLFEALKQTGYCALAKIAMHNREHVVFLRPSAKGIQMHTMYYKDEIRMVDEFRTDTSLVKPAELAMAKTLVQTLAAEFEPEKYSDEYRENLKAMIQAKIEGKQTVEPPVEAHLAPVIDIMEALKMSLENAKKPVRTATGKAAKMEEAATQPTARPKKAKKA
jgi:DNA end-binding protein Ku